MLRFVKQSKGLIRIESSVIEGILRSEGYFNLQKKQQRRQSNMQVKAALRKIFKRSKKEKVIQTGHLNTSIEEVTNSVNLLEKRLKLLEKKSEEETMKAKEYMKHNNKEGAMRCLKMRKQHEAQIQKLSLQINNLTAMIATMESTAVDVESLQSLQRSKKTLESLYKEIGGVEKVENVMEDVSTTMEQARDISNVVSQSITTDIVDEDELEDEYAQLSQEVDTMQLPEVPSHIPARSQKNKQLQAADEFAQLEEELKQVTA